MTLFEDADGGPLPAELVAVTVKLYAVPGASPLIVAVTDVPGTVRVVPPGDAVMVYEVIVDPPVDDGGVQVSVASFVPAVAVTPVGAPGVPVWAEAGSTSTIDVTASAIAIATAAIGKDLFSMTSPPARTNH
ncbi:MAG: hypothetical protein M1420_03650 [Actinobacteria bacterium]|nr:hypothetical protein [Actinomycetota bacterium]